MNYISKTYSLSEDVVARLDALREKHGSVNKALKIVLPVVDNGEADPPKSESPEQKPPAMSQPRRESGFERAAREKAEREARARARSSVGDDPSMDFSDDYVG